MAKKIYSDLDETANESLEATDALAQSILDAGKAVGRGIEKQGPSDSNYGLLCIAITIFFTSCSVSNSNSIAKKRDFCLNVHKAGLTEEVCKDYDFRPLTLTKGSE